ncbi:hypothetical protein [Cellvibrio sp. NN19]|uniref:hypothetical protein n=1 Tax=Cellvibrio chitinivorans TaxID=3102792 RepID=UPI002B40374B|nr:hypothetical protein [Cellvibrio sp. NN19]
MISLAYCVYVPNIVGFYTGFAGSGQSWSTGLEFYRLLLPSLVWENVNMTFIKKQKEFFASLVLLIAQVEEHL